jgi:hypothetical protein
MQMPKLDGAPLSSEEIEIAVWNIRDKFTSLAGEISSSGISDLLDIGLAIRYPA